MAPPSDAFNSIVFEERHDRPYDPMVNANALVIGDLVRRQCRRLVI
jgi:glutaminase